MVRGDQEDLKTNSLTWFRTVSARPAKDQQWVEGVLSSWEDIEGDGREEGGVGGQRGEFSGDKEEEAWIGI